jgi:1-phosphatidylinositol-3-phosphate 5-kinase
MLYTVFAAYHLVLETSFFEDQRTFLNDRDTPNCVGMKEGPSVISHANSDALWSPTDGCLSELTEGTTIDYDSNHAPPTEKIIRSVSGRFIDIFRHQNIYLPVTSQESADYQKEGGLELNQEVQSEDFDAGVSTNGPADSGKYMENFKHFQKQVCAKTNEQMIEADHPTGGEHEKLSVASENGERHSTAYSEEKASHINKADDVLDPQSILILMSSQCIAKQVVCEQSHLSRINYYGNFDVSLGRFLQDILQNQVPSLLQYPI